ncbi:hypothetical protein HOP50_03g24040 [Chloropicon primus]|uniref:C2 domain-containing protein n=1 Tax=Chloropicon primus TaxID=1764295 RepID=A0A5B8MHH9_9CHLO|nr:hypothetical protein A3770_03p24050 [Chloropicon primus]UPQ99098.1 hypothetical protein HOP50_03g24040 [Chloropicon primus]|eukprot:QDZ19887.1 hypothetical protein A3770_03p24050 [Chloropicon primus]
MMEEVRARATRPFGAHKVVRRGRHWPRGRRKGPRALCRPRHAVVFAADASRSGADSIEGVGRKAPESKTVVGTEPLVPAPRGARGIGNFWGFLTFAGAVVVASVGGVVLGARYMTLVPQYSESARARAKRLNEAERNSNRNWDWPMSQTQFAKGSETVEWLNAALRKVWRVYMKQIERWIERRLQRAIDGAVLRRKIRERKRKEEGDFVPLFNLNSVKLVELKLDFQPPVLRAIESRSESRRDSDIGAIANVRYTGGMRALFMVEVSISLQDNETPEEMNEWQRKLSGGYMAIEDEDRGVTNALAPLSLSRPWQIRIPVQVYDLDIESDLWIRARLAPLAPYVGQLSLAFVDSPAVGVQLAPYKRAQLMRIPIIQSFLTKLITEDLPNLMILPRKLNFEIPPSLAAVAGAAIGDDIVRKAILNAVVNSEEQEDMPEEQLEETMKNLMDQSKAQEAQEKSQGIIKKMVRPVQSESVKERIDVESDDEAAEQIKELVKPWTQGGITLPEAFEGELLVTLNSARGLATWEALPGIVTMSAPYCKLELGSQVATTRKYVQKKSNSKNPFLKLGGALYEPLQSSEPVWNQEFQFLVEDASKDELIIQVKDTRTLQTEFTGRTNIGYTKLRVADLEAGVQTPVWLTLLPPRNMPGVVARTMTTGEIFIEATYRAFQDEESDSQVSPDAPQEASVSSPFDEDDKQITDIRSAAEASTKAGITSSMTARALAITKAASVRASVALKQFQKDKTVSAEIVTDAEGTPPAGGGSELGEVSESRVQKMMEVLQERFERDEVTSEKRAARWIARSDRPWFQLVSFLLGTVIVLLVLVAYRLDLVINFS